MCVLAPQNYVGGAITCSTNTGVNHAIQTVGCGYIPSPDGTQQLPVYIVKNVSAPPLLCVSSDHYLSP